MSALDSYKALEALHSIEDKIRAASREALAEHGQALRQAGLIDELAHLRRALILDEIRAIATLREQLKQQDNNGAWIARWLVSPFR